MTKTGQPTATKRSNKKGEAAASGLKIMLTAASLAATVGGWAALTREAARPATTNAAPSAAAALDPASPTPLVFAQPPLPALVFHQPPSSALALNLPPLPTVVPPPARATAPAGHTTLAGSVVAANTANNSSAAPIVPAQPTLRVVDAPPPPPPPSHAQSPAPQPGPAQPPAPVTVTKSSGH